MRTLLTYGLIMLTCLICKAQEQIIGKYIGCQYTETKNISFINRELLFLNNNDSLILNVKLPIDQENATVQDFGIFYNCHLKEDTVYTLTLKKICANDIPEAFNSYYKTNTIPDKKDCSKFTEVDKNTEYNYSGNYGKYVDFDGVLYEITGLSPGGGCNFQH